MQFELEGTKSNRSAVGAQVKVHWNNQVQIQEVSGGNGYASQNQRRVHYGLGKDARVTIHEHSQHAFFNDARPEVYDPEAAAVAWEATLDLFRSTL